MVIDHMLRAFLIMEAHFATRESRVLQLRARRTSMRHPALSTVDQRATLHSSICRWTHLYRWKVIRIGVEGGQWEEKMKAFGASFNPSVFWGGSVPCSNLYHDEKQRLTY